MYFSGWKATMFVTENNAGSQIKLRFCTATLLDKTKNKRKEQLFRYLDGEGGRGGEGGKEKRPPSKKGDPVQLSKLENDQDPLL